MSVLPDHSEDVLGAAQSCIRIHQHPRAVVIAVQHQSLRTFPRSLRVAREALHSLIGHAEDYSLCRPVQ